MSCPIWGTDPSHIFPGNRDGYDATSPRAGGRYFLASSAGAQLQYEGEDTKAKLTTWLVDQRRAGIESPEISSTILSTAKRQRRLGFSARVERFFEYLARKDFTFGDRFAIAGDRLNGTETGQNLCAWMECTQEGDLFALMTILRQQRLVEMSDEGDSYSLTPQGFGRLDELARASTVSRQAFVAMWFDASLNEAFDRGMAPAIHRAGYDPIRIDRTEHNNKIDDEIITRIKASRFIVADFTCGMVGSPEQSHALPRGGVYFEAGYAYGIGVPVIWTCRRDHIDHVHFDTRQFAHILWDTPEQLEAQLYNRIAHVVGLGPGAD